MNGSTTTLAPDHLSLEIAQKRFAREARRGLLDNGRYRCPYYVWGSGPPIVFAHGMGDGAKAFVPLISLLAQDFKCVAYDLPSGRGDGARLSRYTHDDLVADVLALLDHLDLRQSYFFGTSFGSTIGLATMYQAPTRVPRGVIAGGFARRNLSKPEKCLAKVGRVLPGPVRLLPFRKLVGLGSFGPMARQRPDLARFSLEVTGEPPMIAMARRSLMIDRIDLRPILPEILQPTLVITGDCDPLVRRQCAEALLSGLPNALHAELIDCGHFAHYSHPEAVAELIRRFLTPPSCPLAH
jgi:pimeloyl-ACP methyl ester carboxylesterase